MIANEFIGILKEKGFDGRSNLNNKTIFSKIKCKIV